MVLAHGFGWGTEFFPGFAAMMKDLNGYARDRGIKMVTGGYGASYGIAYQSGPLYEEAPYLGKVFKNQESYPSGKLYQCMGFSYSKDPSIDTRTLGSCRANDDLNALKADELRQYVAKPNPAGCISIMKTLEVSRAARSRGSNGAIAVESAGPAMT